MPKAASEDLQPLSPAVFHILLALSGGERHGYAIMTEVTEATGGRFRMGPGTLYGSIKRMIAADLIEETDGRVAPESGDERRRYYRLTPHGRRVCAAESRRLEELVALVRRKGLTRLAPA